MQSSIPTVTAALASEHRPHIYVAEAAALGFPAVAPQYLATDLGNQAALYFTGLDSKGTAIYKQTGRGAALSLHVLGANRERAEQASARAKVIAALREKLEANIGQSERAREELARKITASDDSALCALRNLHSAPALLYSSVYSKTVLKELAAAGEGQEDEALRMSLRRLDRWLESWSPSGCSGSPMLIYLLAEYEAVKELAREIRLAMPKAGA